MRFLCALCIRALGAITIPLLIVVLIVINVTFLPFTACGVIIDSYRPPLNVRTGNSVINPDTLDFSFDKLKLYNTLLSDN